MIVTDEKAKADCAALAKVLGLPEPTVGKRRGWFYGHAGPGITTHPGTTSDSGAWLALREALASSAKRELYAGNGTGYRYRDALDKTARAEQRAEYARADVERAQKQLDDARATLDRYAAEAAAARVSLAGLETTTDVRARDVAEALFAAGVV